MATGTSFNPKTKDEGQSKDQGQNPIKDQGQNRDQGQNKENFDKVKEASSHVMDKAKETAASVGELASQTVSAVGKKADEYASTAGTGVQRMSDNLRESAPHEGILGQASQVMADTLKGSGRYLEEAKLSGMADDVTHLIQRHPVPAALICLSVGFMLGRVFKD